jgi:hypothetical protein
MDDVGGMLLIVTGLGLLVIAGIDIFLTIINIGGGGRLSRAFCDNVWNLFVKISPDPNSAILGYAGGIILTLLFFLWVLIIWAGFSLIFLSTEGSVVDSMTEETTSPIGKIYFVGYTLTSLGNGDVKGGSDTWRIVSNIMGIGSMFFVSLGISYLLPVLQAVIATKTLATYINQLGRTPQDIIFNGWNGKDFSPLYKRFTTLETMILTHSERHLAYPILHYFHATKREYSAPVNLAKLDEAISIQEVFNLDKSSEAYNWQVLRRSLDDYISKIQGVYASPTSEPPPFHYDKIRKEFSIDTLSEETRQKIQNLKERRSLLKGLVEKDQRRWRDLVGGH